MFLLIISATKEQKHKKTFNPYLWGFCYNNIPENKDGFYP